MTRAALSSLPGAALLGQSWPLRNDVYEVSLSKSAPYPSWSHFHQQGLVYTEGSFQFYYTLAVTIYSIYSKHYCKWSSGIFTSDSSQHPKQKE